MLYLPGISLGKRADAFVRIPAYTDRLPESDDNKKEYPAGWKYV